MKLVASNIYPNASREPSLLNDHVILTGLSSIKNDIENNKKNGDTIGSIEEPNGTSQNSNSQKYVYSGLYYINSWTDYSKRQEKKAYSGYYGYAFYYGNKTATNLPVNGVAKYKGTWDFITATEYGKRYSLLSNSGSHAYSRRSAIPEDIDLENDPKDGREKGLVSEFSADFGNKKLTGELFYTKRKTNNQEYKREKLYDIDAHIYSNRFRGKVIPKDKNPKSTEHPFTSEGTLEGGFYGPNGEELGGKFLAGDNRVFGVFSAKENPENKTLSRETLIDGKLTTFKRTDATTSTTTNTAANAITDAENFKTEDISSFGEADYLLIDKYPIPLFPEENTDDFVTSKHHDIGNKTYKVEACCNNLSYVKFGMYYEDKSTTEEKDKEKQTAKDKEKQTAATTNTYYQFLLGQRTVSSEIPKMGSAKYHGSWFGYITDGKTSYSTTGDKQRDKSGVSDFNVDFDKKTLTGELKRHDNQNTVFNIKATFQNGKNDFEGTAHANNVAIDSQNTQGTPKVNFTATVKGAFYGPNATELGGYFTYNGKNPTPTAKNSPAVPSPPNSEKARAAVVFGAKKQVDTTNK
ncbi:putative transferrin-binding protein 2 [Haemophilus influenzae]|nr:putative transferrin-binding protein 2 [Haemophilus influenzae]GBK74276.1 putative transferrin-binding protein 2 [Haemophilus influenzae]